LKEPNHLLCSAGWDTHRENQGRKSPSPIESRHF